MAQSELVNSFKCYDIKTLFWGEQHTCLHLTGNRSRVGERCTGFCPFHVATVAKTGQQTPKTWPSYRILAIFMYDASGRCNQSGALISGNGAMHSPLSLARCSTFPAVRDLRYCQSLARFFCSMVWNPCKPAVFLPYCQSFGRFFCNVVNIHRHRPIARFICNDSCFCAIWPYFDYRYRPNGEFMCNDCSYEETPVNFEAKIHPYIFGRRAPRTLWMGRFTCHVGRSRDVFQKNSHLTFSCEIVLPLELWRRSWQKVQYMYISSFFCD